jgi:hypothetical protein
VNRHSPVSIGSAGVKVAMSTRFPVKPLLGPSAAQFKLGEELVEKGLT